MQSQVHSDELQVVVPTIVGALGRRRPQRVLVRENARLDFARFGRADFMQLDSVGAGASQQLVQPFGGFALIARHHQLAARVERDAAVLAELGERAVAIATEARLERVGGVVEAGMQNTRVTP